ncbi:unnamed protein product [Cochlearia groenlandica]
MNPWKSFQAITNLIGAVKVEIVYRSRSFWCKRTPLRDRDLLRRWSTTTLLRLDTCIGSTSSHDACLRNPSLSV